MRRTVCPPYPPADRGPLHGLPLGVNDAEDLQRLAAGFKDLLRHLGVAFQLNQRLDLSPLVVILSLAFWASVWGVVGMIMAVPLMVTVKIIMENIPATRPLAALLANVRDEK